MIYPISELTNFVKPVTSITSSMSGRKVMENLNGSA